MEQAIPGRFQFAISGEGRRDVARAQLEREVRRSVCEGYKAAQALARPDWIPPGVVPTYFVAGYRHDEVQVITVSRTYTWPGFLVTESVRLRNGERVD